MFTYNYNLSVGGKTFGSCNSDPEKSEKYESFSNADYISPKHDEYIREISTEEVGAVLSTERQQANNIRNMAEEEYVISLSSYSVDIKFLETTKAIIEHKYTMVQLIRLTIENVPFPPEIISLGLDDKCNASIYIQDIYATYTTLTECLGNRSSDKNLTGYFPKQYVTNFIFESNISRTSTSTVDTKIISKHLSNSHKETMEDSSNEMLYTLPEMPIHCQQRLEIFLKRILLVERYGQYGNAIVSNSKNRGKLLIRLNVITSDVFRDAMTNYRRSTYVLTYSRFFPNNCRMFIEIPINKNGSIGRLEEKQRHYN